MQGFRDNEVIPEPPHPVSAVNLAISFVKELHYTYARLFVRFRASFNALSMASKVAYGMLSPLDRHPCHMLKQRRIGYLFLSVSLATRSLGEEIENE